MILVEEIPQVRKLVVTQARVLPVVCALVSLVYFLRFVDVKLDFLGIIEPA
jgi:hypothetical protein